MHGLMLLMCTYQYHVWFGFTRVAIFSLLLLSLHPRIVR